jgi:ubiquinone/menaquinone biosynthesis C-methylase UbiE
MTGVGREPQYEAIADEFRAHATAGFFNAFVDRPACLDLLGDVAGRRVLDAACGPGIYAEELTARGATVVGFDHSPRMVGLASARVPTAEFRVHDLGAPIDWMPDTSVDLALCALAIEYVDDRAGALAELRRVLAPGGALVLSKLHPTADWLRHGGDYFEPRVVEELWTGTPSPWPMRFWIEPLERTLATITDAGFLVERLVEPRPVPAARGVDPERYERYSGQPFFIAFRCVPR